MQKTKKFYSNQYVHWFWNLTTKWWFFPIFYLFLVLLVTVIWKVKGTERTFLSTLALLLIYMPSGLLVFLDKLRVLTGDSLTITAGFFPYFFHPVAIASLIVIQYYKYKKNKILKWLVLTLLFLLVLAFVGCTLSEPLPTHT